MRKIFDLQVDVDKCNVLSIKNEDDGILVEAVSPNNYMWKFQVLYNDEQCRILQDNNEYEVYISSHYLQGHILRKLKPIPKSGLNGIMHLILLRKKTKLLFFKRDRIEAIRNPSPFYIKITIDKDEEIEEKNILEETALNRLMKYISDLTEVEYNDIITILNSLIVKFNDSYDPSKKPLMDYFNNQNYYLNPNEVPTEESDRMDKFIPTHLLNLPELKEIWITIKTILLEWEILSWRNHQHRKQREDSIHKKVFFGSIDRYYWILVCNRIYPQMPKELRSKISSYFPPCYYMSRTFLCNNQEANHYLILSGYHTLRYLTVTHSSKNIQELSGTWKLSDNIITLSIVIFFEEEKRKLMLIEDMDNGYKLKTIEYEKRGWSKKYSIDPSLLYWYQSDRPRHQLMKWTKL